MTPLTIDLNCDLGESEDPLAIVRDAQLLQVVTSANIACGGHAGNMASMIRTMRLARQHGVAIGAHPSYADAENFGRLETGAHTADIFTMVDAQLQAFWTAAKTVDAQPTHLKPHGALYHRVAVDEAAAEAVGQAARKWNPDLRLIGLSGSAGVAMWRRMRLSVREEAFADRRYLANGSLMSRQLPGAVMTDAKEAVAQACRIAAREPIATSEGGMRQVHADTICVHSDTPGAIELARSIRLGLESQGIRVASSA